MKKTNVAVLFSILFLAGLFIAAPSFAKLLNSSGVPARNYFQPKHMDISPDGTSQQYLQVFRHLGDGQQIEAKDSLDDVVAAGERNLDWLKYINSFRPEGQKLSFTGIHNRIGYPIDKPNAYSEKIILTDYDKFMNQAPEKFRGVILGDKILTKEPPLPEPEYLELGRKLDRQYQSALRWRLLIPYKEEMIANQIWDIRGYYFLSKVENLDQTLQNYKNLPADEKAELKGYLVSLCRNSDLEKSSCADQLDQDLKMSARGALMFYRRYEKTSRSMFEYFFKIPEAAKRTDIVWNAKAPQIATIPFLEPEAAIKNFMLNVEDEWTWDGWRLILDFRKQGFGIPHIEFEPGTTPHVNELGGNVITMDANTPLTEWEVSWTIRHEFGHVLGFPDCYVEFYNTELDAMMNYQIDVSNLMCSRQGNLKETHYTEMKRSYLQ